ncbi:hypothetical protein GN244_ATG14630 [Phytophthora infestans]|uniref:ZSWIM1/3 RNaseH-like domain-containing protein n=1 Tax=Phytophthora infestans TaxID=4787 RepID=A0A833SW61_PHYIN|nr:hypothetical protein GN244_ATG14630 [Phytophthora infestans]
MPNAKGKNRRHNQACCRSIIVVDFNMKVSRNVSTVHQSARGNTGAIAVTCGHMRAMCDKFPEVIQMDMTYKIKK